MTPPGHVVRQLLDALQSAVQAVEPAAAIHRHLQRDGNLLQIDNQTWQLDQIDLRLVAVGKAAVPMAEAIAVHLADQINQAIVVTPHHTVAANLPPAWQILFAAHPIPDAGSLAAGRAVGQLLANSTAQTLILACVSGGATALLLDPPTAITLPTLQAIYKTLLASGANIQEMNAVRSRLDQLKGGGLVNQAQPAQVVGLILSDVVGDSLATIGSGLTNHALAHNILVGNNTEACQAAATVLQNNGYTCQILTTALQGEAQVVGRAIAQAIMTAAPGTALIYGGETTVTLPPSTIGQGGRNQELALAAALEFDQNQQPVWLASMGTDGIDGTSDAAGAWVHAQTIQQAREKGCCALTALEHHDSYHFFRAINALVMTGATGTNVADIVIALRP